MLVSKEEFEEGGHSVCLPTIREVSHPDRVEMVLEIPMENEVTMVKEDPTINRRPDDKLPINGKIETISVKV